MKGYSMMKLIFTLIVHLLTRCETISSEKSQPSPYSSNQSVPGFDKRSSNGAQPIQAASDAQIRTLCRVTSCWFIESDEIVITDFRYYLPSMLSYLEKNRLKIVGKNLQIKLDGLMAERIRKKGDNYVFEFSRASPLTFTDSTRTHLTENTVELELIVSKELKQIDAGFFEKYFPNMKKLSVKPSYPTKGKHPLPGLHIGFLPKLQYFRFDYPINGNLSGCILPIGETACFADNMVMILLDGRHEDVTYIKLVDMHLPLMKIFKLDLHETILNDSKSLQGVTIQRVKIHFKSTSQIAGINFIGSVIKNEFKLNGGKPGDVVRLTKHLDGILHNPTIAKIWSWDYPKSPQNVCIPVVFGTSETQRFDSLNAPELGNGQCSLAKEIVTFHNQYLNDVSRRDEKNPRMSTKILIIREFYVDITQLIDAVQSRSFDQLEVTAMHVHVSASRTVRYKLHVSYMKITANGDSAIFTQYAKKDGSIRSRGFAGTELQWEDSVDSVFIKAYKTCTAVLIAKERNVGGTENGGKSIGFQLWSYKLPSILTGTDREVAKAQEMLVKVGTLMEYWYEATLKKAMKVPYLSLEYQQENLAILLQMAENLLTEKRHLNLKRNLNELKVDILNQQDRATIALLKTEYKRTVSLVLISTRRAHDIEKKLNATMDLVQEVSATFDKYKAAMEKENVTFMAGVRRAQAFAYAEVAAAVTSSVISFFSGGFDAGKIARAAKKAKDLALKAKKLMNLSNIFKKLGRLIKTLRNIQELSRQASNVISGRVGKLFNAIKNLRKKRDSHLTRLLKNSKSFPFEYALLLKKQHENKIQLAKYKKIAKKIKRARNSVEYLNSIMQGIVDAEKAKVALANAYQEGPIELVNSGQSPAVTKKAIDQALRNEFAVAAGDQRHQMDELMKTLKSYELTESKNVVEEGERLNAADVLEWDAANANVESTMDASLSMDIPETTNFKAALLKMNLAGKLKTQAMIDEAVIRVDLDRARFETTTYFREGAAILAKIKQVEDGLRKRVLNGQNLQSHEFRERYEKMIQEVELNRKWRKFSVKLNILIGSLSFCSAYYYFHLSECPPDHIFDFDANLKDIIYQQRELQRQSLLQLEDFYPPPQTMQNRSMIFTEPNTTCQCMSKVKQHRNFNTLYGDWMACTSGVIDSAADINSADTKRLLQLLDRECQLNKISEMKELNRIEVPIRIDTDFAKDHSRVRIDEIQIFLQGARTDNGVITASIQSSGLSQDRYRGRIYDFYGDKWKRDFSYYSPQNRKDLANNNKVAPDRFILDAADVYHSFKGVYRTSTLFTTWIINIDPKRNPGLDLSGLQSITLKFSGSFVAGEDYKLDLTKSDAGDADLKHEIPDDTDDVSDSNPDNVNDDDPDDEQNVEDGGWYSTV